MYLKNCVILFGYKKDMKHCNDKPFKTLNQMFIYGCTYSIEYVSFFAFNLDNHYTDFPKKKDKSNQINISLMYKYRTCKCRQ